MGLSGIVLAAGRSSWAWGFSFSSAWEQGRCGWWEQQGGKHIHPQAEKYLKEKKKRKNGKQKKYK